MLLQCAFLCVLLTATLAADVCQEYPASPLKPAFDLREFSAEIEMAQVEKGTVQRVDLTYSAVRQQIRMRFLDAGIKKELIYLGNEGQGEVLKIGWDGKSKSCQVSDFAAERSQSMFFVGGDKQGKIQEPLGFLRLTGYSGFGQNQIALQKMTNPPKIRDMDVDGWQSCQKWQSSTDTLVLKVEHFFSKPGNPWKYSYAKTMPIMIRVTASGTYNGKPVTNFIHVYSFFNFKPVIDPVHLETPRGIYCQRRASYPFPPVPEQIQFTAEVINNDLNSFTYLEEIYDARNNFGVMKMNGQTIFRPYASGLSFNIQDDTQVCSVLNISQARPLPFDFSIGDGVIRQLSPKQFFYDSGDTHYEYLGERTIRGMLCDVFVAKVMLLPARTTEAVIEWYFAKHNVKSWNDMVSTYKNGNMQMPVHFTAWYAGAKNSIDINIFHADFSRMLFGTVDIRPCFSQTKHNHFQLILKGNNQQLVIADLEFFKWTAVTDIAKVSQLDWWRIADFQIFYNSNDVVLEFQILDIPPQASDVDPPPRYVNVQQAFDNLKNAVNSGFSIRTWNAHDKDMTNKIPVIIGTVVL